MKVTNIAVLLLLPFFTNSIITLTVLALPVSVTEPSDNSLIARDAASDTLSTRQLVGAALRGLGKGGKKQGENGKPSDASVRANAEAMAKNLAKIGRPQIMECLLGKVAHMMQFGGANGNWPCDANKSNPKGIAERASRARAQAFASLKKKK